MSGFIEEYELKTTMSVTFWCNPAQLDQMTALAEKQLLHDFYSDVLHRIAALELAVASEDKERALAICTEIKTDLGLV